MANLNYRGNNNSGQHNNTKSNKDLKNPFSL